MSHGLIPERYASAARSGLAPIARALGGMGVSASVVTAIGLVLTLVGAILVAGGLPGPALAVLLFSLMADTLDGEIARSRGGGTRWGAFFDSTADRLADGALFAGASWLAAGARDGLLLAASLLALVAAQLVSYVRAKAESLSVRATVGLAPREARSVIFLAGMAAWAVSGVSVLFTAAVAAIAVLATVTVLQRIAVVARALAR